MERRGVFTSLVFLCLFLASASFGQERFEAEIRWTSYGVPHIRATNFKNLGYGSGYAFSTQNFCILADQLLKVKSLRSRYFGAGEEGRNIVSDIGYKALNVIEDAERLFPTLSQRGQDLVEGYAAGYNQYLEETGVANLPRPCQGAEWVAPTTKEELLAYYFTLAMLSSGDALVPMFVLAKSPLEKEEERRRRNEDSLVPAELPEMVDFRNMNLGSNAWGIGSEYSDNGRGKLLANPHFPGVGALKFYQQHLTIPGVIDINGVSIYGTPVVQIGFNNNLAWSHTVSTSKHFNFYSLKLNRNNPMQYRYGDQIREITSREHRIEVLQEDGSLLPHVQRTYYSHYGPIIEATLMSWSATNAYTFRDANKNNTDFLDQWFEMGAAQNLGEFQEAFRRYRGTPWVNTIYSDREGNAYFVEGTPVPNLSDEAYRSWAGSFFAQLVHGSSGAFLFNGSNPANEWRGERGLVPFEESPRLHRRDFVGNHNNSHWLTNINEPLEGFPLAYGSEGTQQSLRTRMGNSMIFNNRGEDRVFSHEELISSFFNNKVHLEELIGESLRERCRDNWSRDSRQNLREACRAFLSWDGKMDLDSTGGHVFREFAAAFKSKHFAVKFDSEAPLNTPRGLRRPGFFGDSIKSLFLGAIEKLETAEIDFFAPLRSIQYFQKENTRIPFSGPMSFAGGFNVVSHSAGSGRTLYEFPQTEVVNRKSGLSSDGYLINGGPSVVMFVEFLEEGVRADGFLSYSQSSHWDSPHYSDQNWLYSRKEMRPFLYTEEEITGDPSLRIDAISR